MTWPLFSKTSTDMSADLVLFNQTCETLSVKTATLSIQHTCLFRELLWRCSCNIYAFWPNVTVTNTAAVRTCLLVECCCKLDACWTVAIQPACLQIFFSLNIACLLALSFSICYTCWYGVSLSAVSAGMVSHYQLCLRMW